MTNEKIKLSEIVRANPSSWSKNLGWSHIRYLDTVNITEGRINEIVSFDTQKDKIPSRARRIVENGDVIYSTVRPNQLHYGIIKDVPENLLVSTGFVVLRNKKPKEYDLRYIYHLITQKKLTEYLHGVAENNTSTYPSLKPKDITNLEFHFPPLGQQRSVSDFVELLDDKIKNNRQMNETLEEMARAIFKSWFVDFDPVHAKAAGNTPAHMDADTAALFPNSFGDDGLPVGWVNKAFGDVCKITTGKRPPTKMTTPDNQNNISVYGGNGITWYTNKVLFESPFIITGRVGTLGTVYRVYEKCWVSDNALCCFPNDEDAFELVYFAMQEIDYQALNSGSTQPLLTQTTLKNQSIITPSKELISAFHQNTEILFKKVWANDEENQTLTELRDTLLPKLMSGKICMKDTEREVEDL